MQKLTLSQVYSRISNVLEFLTIGSTPADEDCTQAGHDLEAQKWECRALAAQLRRMYGNPPEGAELIIVTNHHEIGTYHELGILYTFTPEPQEEEYYNSKGVLDEEGQAAYYAAHSLYRQTDAEKYAYKLERLPENWDAEARQELRAAGHRMYQPAKVVETSFVNLKISYK